MYSLYGIAKLRHFSGLPNLFGKFLQNLAKPMPMQERLFHENEEDGENEAAESGEMIPLEGLSLEQEHCHEREDRQGNDLLDNL